MPCSAREGLFFLSSILSVNWSLRHIKYISTFIVHSPGNLHLQIYIAKTCLYNVDPIKPHFYIVKLGFTGVYISFPISAQKRRLWVLVRTASPRCSNEYHNLCLSRNMKNVRNYIWKVSFMVEKMFSIFEQACFHNGYIHLRKSHFCIYIL